MENHPGLRKGILPEGSVLYSYHPINDLMAIQDSQKLIESLKPFPPETRDRVLKLREFVWKLYPKTNELIYDHGNQYRYLLVRDMKDFPKTDMKKLLKDVFVNFFLKVKNPKEITEGKTLVKSVSAKKRKA